MRLIARGFFAGVALLLAAFPARAALPAYPTKPLRLVTGSAPGGGSDFVARTLAEKLGERLSQTVLVDNRPGAGGAIGADVVAKANPDGYTLLVNTGSGIAVNPALQALPYEVKRDFAPVLLVSRAPFVLAVHPSLAAKNVTELLALLKAQPKKYSYASSGMGAMSHLAMELFKSVAGVNVVHVPYRGSAPAAVDLIAGQVQLAMNNIVPTLPHVQSGRLRALGVSSAKRSGTLPDVPTIAEAGVPGYEMSPWIGVYVPANTPKEIIAKLNSEINKALKAPEVNQLLASQALDPLGGTPEEFDARIKIDYEKYGKLIKLTGAKVD